MPDDAAVYRLDEETALIATTDFFTPIVDDPYAYGVIAAANALSDIYAIGGRPLMALNIVAVPEDLPEGVLEQILRGMAEKVRESGAVIAGGHSVQDKEPKVGLAVVGLAHPDKLLTKGRARAGDVLVLTKPLGTGCITTAAKRDKAQAEHVQEAIAWMSRLNRVASEAALEAGAKAATDVTGFGLLGHATEMALASNVTLHFSYEKVPLLAGAAEYGAAGLFPGGSARNRKAYQEGVRFAADLSETEQMLLFDAQTSGGLLIALAADQLDNFSAAMARHNEPFWQIGAVVPPDEQSLVVTREV